MNNPFDWKNYKPIVDMKDLNVAWRNSYNMSRHINEKRKNGIEPSKPYGDSPGGVPQEYVTTTAMPKLKKQRKKK